MSVSPKPPAVESTEPETLGPANILDGLASMPAVQQHAIDNARADREADTAAAAEVQSKIPAGLTDGQGRPFDPALHEVNDDGTPRVGSRGKILCKRGRGSSNFSGAPGAKSTFKPKAAGASGPAPVPVDPEARIQATATVTAQMVFLLGQTLGGPEWAPREVIETPDGSKVKVDERGMMQTAWADYYRAAGIVEIPPWMGLAIALGGYALPRFTMPETKSRYQRAKEAIYGWLGRRKARQEAKRADARESAAISEASRIHPMTP